MIVDYAGFVETPGFSEFDKRYILDLRKSPMNEAYNKIVELEENQRNSIMGKILLDRMINDYSHSDYDYEVLCANYIKLLGYEAFKKTGGSKFKLSRGIQKAMLESLAQTDEIIAKVRKEFSEKHWVSTVDAKEKLQEIYDESNMSITAKGANIKLYFTVRDSQKKIDGKAIRGFEIID